MNNEKQLGLAMQNYASTFSNSFPASASLNNGPVGESTVGGYSFLVKLLPFMEYDTLYRSLPQKTLDLDDTTNPAIATAMKTQLKEFICPSVPLNAEGQGPAASPPFAITSYKALGTSSRDSLKMVLHPHDEPPYGPKAVQTARTYLHPDGAIYPSARNLPMADILDGTSHTILIVESMDSTASRWMVGKEATLVGLPQKSSPTGTAPQAPYNYFAPRGYDVTFGENSGVARAGLRTFFAYDFSPRGADAGTYEDAGFSKTAPAYGPSSMHAAVVICAMGDGSVQALSKKVDAANLFFLTTKNNSDPFFIPQ